MKPKRVMHVPRPMSPDQARDFASWNRGVLYTLAVCGLQDDEDKAFWQAVNPLGRAIHGRDWSAKVREAWLKATPEEGYDNTFKLLSLPPLPEMTFAQFQATGRDVANLLDEPEVKCQTDLEEPKPGRVYLTGGLYIEKEPDGSWYLIIERDETRTADLEHAEMRLYCFYCTEYAS